MKRPHLKPAMRAWLLGGRLRRWRGRKRGLDLWENRRRLIRELAPGKSFIDVGGMWGIDGEVAFRAEEAGATNVVLFDAMPPTPEFEKEHARRSSRVRCVRGDLHDPESVEGLGTFDVVWCSGVIYHSPSPFTLLENFRRLTGDHLLLGTRVIPEIPGFEQACLFYPGLSHGARRAFARADREHASQAVGLTLPFDRTPVMAYANWWWGITPSALRSMLDISGFEVTDEFVPHPFFVDVLARPAYGLSRSAA